MNTIGTGPPWSACPGSGARAGLRVSGSDGALLAAIVDGSGDAIVVLTKDGVITSWNPAAEKLYGFTAQEAQGQSIAIVNGPGEEDYLRLATSASCGDTSTFEAEYIRRDGSRVELAVTLGPREM